MDYYTNQPMRPGGARAPRTPESQIMTPPAMTAGYGAVVKKEVAPKTPRALFSTFGVVLFMVLLIVPIWNTAALMQDENYVFWCGKGEPRWLMGSCLFVLFLYVATVQMFFTHARPSVQTEQTLLMIGNVFITLLGLVLMLGSLPLNWQTVETYNNIMHRCDYSAQTHRLYEYSQVLHNIRRQPECVDKYSVEECDGYMEVAPYTSFLKVMETDMRCSGFCYRPLNLSTLQTSTSGSLSRRLESDPASATATLMQFAKGNVLLSYAMEAVRARKHGNDVQQHLLVEDPGLPSNTAASIDAASTSLYGLGPTFANPGKSLYPPSLFSNSVYQASCDGMAARALKTHAGDIGFQTFYQGIYFVLIAIMTGFLKLVGFCVRKDRDIQYLQPRA